MAEPLFAGLVFSEDDQPLTTAPVGEAWCYVHDDAGFRRHIPARGIDEAILRWLWERIRGHERELAEHTARMTGQDDLFSMAVLRQNLEHPEEQMEKIFAAGLPEQVRAWMGMVGFRAVVNIHGELVRVDQPAGAGDGES
jgi:hypothetical protein